MVEMRKIGGINTDVTQPQAEQKSMRESKGYKGETAFLIKRH